MPEEILFESERRMDQAEIAAYLQTVVDRLETGDDLTLTAGEESITLTPSARPTFEVKVEREGPVDGPTELSIEFELEWDENGDDGGGDLTIE